MRCRRYSQGLLMTYSVQLPFDRLCLQREVAASGSAVNRRYIGCIILARGMANVKSPGLRR